MFTFDKNRAIEVIKYELRRKRTKLFSDLDIQFMRAVETGNTELQQQIGSKKQQLRDITDINIDSVTNREELLQLWPTELIGECPFK